MRIAGKKCTDLVWLGHTELALLKLHIEDFKSNAV